MAEEPWIKSSLLHIVVRVIFHFREISLISDFEVKYVVTDISPELFDLKSLFVFLP